MGNILLRGNSMKDLGLIVWLTQLGFSVVCPPAALILLAVWLQKSCGWGQWVIWAAIVLGFYCAVQGFRSSLKTMERMSQAKKEQRKPPDSFNDHE